MDPDEAFALMGEVSALFSCIDDPLDKALAGRLDPDLSDFTTDFFFSADCFGNGGKLAFELSRSILEDLGFTASFELLGCNSTVADFGSNDACCEALDKSF